MRKPEIRTGSKILRPAAYILFAALFVIASCAAPRYEVKKGSGYMTASWYGPGFHGKQTSSGERYDMYGFTCAHKSLPFGTKLRVTYEESGKSADVVVNDRGPFVDGRDLDLSYGAAKEIGIVGPGTGSVKVEHLGRDTRYVKRVGFSSGGSGPFTIQVGSFTEQDNARRLKDALDLGYKDVYITTALINGETYYRVRLGKFNTRERAYQNAKVLADEGYSTLVTSYEGGQETI